MSPCPALLCNFLSHPLSPPTLLAHLWAGGWLFSKLTPYLSSVINQSTQSHPLPSLCWWCLHLCLLPWFLPHFRPESIPCLLYSSALTSQLLLLYTILHPASPLPGVPILNCYGDTQVQILCWNPCFAVPFGISPKSTGYRLPLGTTGSAFFWTSCVHICICTPIVWILSTSIDVLLTEMH
jgi:hypothetical protein